MVRIHVVVSNAERLVGNPLKTPSHLPGGVFKFLPNLLWQESMIGESMLPHFLEAIVPTHLLMLSSQTGPKLKGGLTKRKPLSALISDPSLPLSHLDQNCTHHAGARDAAQLTITFTKQMPNVCGGWRCRWWAS